MKKIILLVLSSTLLFFLVKNQNLSNFLIYASGVLLGTIFLYLDAKYSWQIYKLKEPLSRSLIFYFVLMVMSCYVFSSSDSILTYGFIWSMNLYLLFEIIDLRKDQVQLNKWYLKSFNSRKPLSYRGLILFLLAYFSLLFYLVL